MTIREPLQQPPKRTDSTGSARGDLLPLGNTNELTTESPHPQLPACPRMPIHYLPPAVPV